MEPTEMGPRRSTRLRRAQRFPPNGDGRARRRRSLAAADRLSALPDDTLRHILGLLPAHDAVRTCMLGRRWRHLWKSASGLEEIREFLDNLLLARGASALETCVLNLEVYNEDDDDDAADANRWMRHVVMHEVQKLIFYCDELEPPWFVVDDVPLISQHLTRLELGHIVLKERFVDFSSCPVLEEILMHCCEMTSANRISSQSLKSLWIIDGIHFDEHSRIRIHTPNLVKLWMEISFGRAPILESMPYIEEAVLIINTADDCCSKDVYYGNCDFEACGCCHGIEDDNTCVLLQSLSEAKKLDLSSEFDTFTIFRRDLKWHTTIFSNLKTLVLNKYWCVPADFSALASILECSPVLEKLTLELFLCKGPTKVEIKGSPDPTERSTAISEHLKIVEVKCGTLDQSVLDVLKFLSKLNIHSYRFDFKE